MTIMGLFLLETTTTTYTPTVNYGELFAPIAKMLIFFAIAGAIIDCLKIIAKNNRKKRKRSRQSNASALASLLNTPIKTKKRTANTNSSTQPHYAPAQKSNFSYRHVDFEHHTISSPDGRNAGERNLERLLGRCYQQGYTGYFLHNVYVPMANDTTEVDAVYVTAKGIFVFESKDYSGWIFGSDTQKQWMQTFPNGSKNPFPNPIWQNDVHIQCLGEFLKWKIPFFSFVVFSDNCEIKKMSVVKSQAKVIQQFQLPEAVANTFNALPDVFSDEQMQTIWQALYPLTQKTAAEKDAHVANVQNRHNANENTRAAQPIYVASAPVPTSQPAQAEQTPVCPLCGKALQERVAQNGDHAGQTYEVCTDYPNCTYAKIKE